MTRGPDDPDARRREYAARVGMGEPPVRAAGVLQLRPRSKPSRLTREFLRRWCIGFGGGGWRS